MFASPVTQQRIDTPSIRARSALNLDSDSEAARWCPASSA